MKITDIFETTTSGAIATVATPMGKTQSRNGVGKGIYPGVKGGNLLTGKATTKKFANSKPVKESKQIEEAHLEEDDLILVPGQGHRLKSGFIPHDKDRTDHEVEMAKSDLFQAAKNAKQVYEMIQGVSEEEGLEGWVQEKIIKANDYLNTVREYLEGKRLQEMTGGVIAAGGVGEATAKPWSARDIESGVGSHLKPDDLSPDALQSLSGRRSSGPQKPTHITTTDLSFQNGETIPAGSYIRSSYGPGPSKRRHVFGVLLVDGKPKGLYKIPKEYTKPIEDTSVSEGAKVDRMVKHIEKSERKLGKSKEKASDIAWATANKRGMLDNKNKKG